MWEVGFVVIALACAVLCAFVLYNAARRDGANPWVWGAVGLLGNVVGVLIYRLSVGKIIKY
ncbi:MAG: hypothetical protein KF883_01925 [Thermomicrobiales bacterium]|nr:hypothetical protein [Thermomicrobiales bacterium]